MKFGDIFQESLKRNILSFSEKTRTKGIGDFRGPRTTYCRCFYFRCSCTHRLLIKCNVDYPSLDLYAHVVGFRLPQGEEPRANQGRVRTRYEKPGKAWNLKMLFSRPGKSWNLIDLLEIHGKLKFYLID